MFRQLLLPMLLAAPVEAAAQEFQTPGFGLNNCVQVTEGGDAHTFTLQVENDCPARMRTFICTKVGAEGRPMVEQKIVQPGGIWTYQRRKPDQGKLNYAWYACDERKPCQPACPN